MFIIEDLTTFKFRDGDIICDRDGTPWLYYRKAFQSSYSVAQKMGQSQNTWVTPLKLQKLCWGPWKYMGNPGKDKLIERIPHV